MFGYTRSASVCCVHRRSRSSTYAINVAMCSCREDEAADPPLNVRQIGYFFRPAFRFAQNAFIRAAAALR
jgi:hypothetical protein